ncbi:unnamed protein product, partial [Brenthis ino]
MSIDGVIYYNSSAFLHRSFVEFRRLEKFSQKYGITWLSTVLKALFQMCLCFDKLPYDLYCPSQKNDRQQPVGRTCHVPEVWTALLYTECKGTCKFTYKMNTNIYLCKGGLITSRQPTLERNSLCCMDLYLCVHALHYNISCAVG